jgi:hypothetical protein
MFTLTRTSTQKMYDRLRLKLAENPDLRETFFTQPKAVLAEELGWQVPEEIELKVVKATATQHYVTLPCQIEGAQMDANSTAESEFEDGVVRRALGDPDFKHRLLTQPKATLEEILHFRLPAAVTITVLEETPQTWYVVCPLLPDMVADELDDRALEAVAGGASSSMNDSGGNHAQLPCETEPTSSFARSQKFRRPRFQRPRFPICH